LVTIPVPTLPRNVNASTAHSGERPPARPGPPGETIAAGASAVVIGSVMRVK
jgi:hypothetical protein